MQHEESFLAEFGVDAVARTRNALAAMRRGQPVLVLDDEDRENEADLIVPAEALTVETMAMMIRHGSGIVCLCMTGERLDALDIPPMVDQNTSRMGTAFAVSIEAREGVTTGVSAVDRVRTVAVAMDPEASPEDLARPGHVFPIRAAQGGVLTRRGHTESAVDLARLSGYQPAGVLCELMNDDGTMARGDAVLSFARTFGLTAMCVEDLVAYRRAEEAAVEAEALAAE